ncbi:MAG TPA: hypothetical protein VKE70_36790 [Candidatus Solibacter sp.]|nr:hypothetical protein [Candidatus Solibacter sp.]
MLDLDYSDILAIAFLVLIVLAVFQFPGGPGTPLRQKVGSRA